MRQEHWGEIPGMGAVSLYTIEKGTLRVSVSDYGATLVALETPDRRGHWDSVILGYDTPAAYAAGGSYLGATVGRYANRIGGAVLPLDGVDWPLTANENGNCLHGGVGFSRRRWEAAAGEDEVVFTYRSPHGEDGFPGTVEVQAAYRLEGENTLAIRYRAVSDRRTVVNLTNHAYFNLDSAPTINGHTLRLAASAYTPVDGQLLPTGELRPVEGTVFDFRQGRKVESSYDHNFVLDAGTGAKAVLTAPKSGRQLKLFTDLPGLQLYTGDGLGAPHHSRQGLCLEAQYFPNAPHHPQFPSCILEPGAVYEKYILLELSIEE